MISNHSNLFKALQVSIENIDTTLIPHERKQILRPLTAFIRKKYSASEKITLNFICSHNSRRSHLAQIWAQALANYFGFENFECFSAGTEATAVYPEIVLTLQKSGFEFSKLTEGDNPVYEIKFAENEQPIRAFSKSLDHPSAPKDKFAAIMVCSEADDACPHVYGAEARFAIPYSDPKEYDNSPLQKEKYSERSLQIAREIYYVLSEAKENIPAD